MITVDPEIGNLNNRLVTVGEAPGDEELKQGRPFIGPTGKKVVDGISMAAINRSQVILTNLSRYKPEEDESEEARVARRAWQIPALSEELMGYQNSRTLLLLGAQSIEAVLGICGPQRDPENPKRRLTPSILDYHGSTFTREEALALQDWARDHGIPVIDGLPPNVHSVAVSLHPAFALRGMPRFMREIIIAIGRAALLSQQDNPPQRPDESEIELMATPEMVGDFLSTYRNKPITKDVETPYDNPRHITICGIGLVDESTRKVLVFPWDESYQRLLRDALAQPGETAGHNLLYDLRAWAAYKIWPARKHIISDTITACARLHPVDDEVRDFTWLSLAACVARHKPGFYYWKEQERSCQQALYRATAYAAGFPEDVTEDMRERFYNSLDVYKNSELWEVVRPRLQREGML